MAKYLSSSLTIVGMLLTAGTLAAQPQPLPKAVQGHGGNGMGHLTSLSDLDVTAMTKLDEASEKERRAALAARTALLTASLNPQVSREEIAAKANALGDAEMALALARARAFPELKAKISPEKMPSGIQALETMGASRGRGAAPIVAPAAPAARGN